MPILTEPDQEFEIVLERDKDKKPLPCFLVKACSARKQRELYKMLDKYNVAIQEDDIDSMFDITIDQLKDVVVGWKNMGVDYAPELIEDVLTFEEMRELAAKVRSNQYAQEGEKKSLES